MRKGCQPGSWFVRNRMTLVSLVAVVAYVAFVQWIWGWPTLFRQWAEIGIVPVLSALALLVGTYFVRCYRIYDYFPGETRGRFLQLLRVTQVHNLLNIMLRSAPAKPASPCSCARNSPFRSRAHLGTCCWMRVLDLHALFAAAGFGLVLGTRRSASRLASSGTAPSPRRCFFLFEGQRLAFVERRAGKARQAARET